MTDPDIPPGFGALARTSPHIVASGPIYVKREGAGKVLGLRVLDRHINTRGFVHGGVLCSLADLAIGHNLAPDKSRLPPFVTANLSVDFAGNAKLGDWLECRVDVQRVGGRLAFANAYIWHGEKRIVRASAIFARAEAGLG